MILEGLVTSRSPQGTPHVAGMGPEVDADRLRSGDLVELLLKPFATSHTARNLEATAEGVFQTTDDVLLLARTVVGVGPTPALVRAEVVDGWRLADACMAWEFRVVDADRSADRQRLVARVVRVHRGRPFQGHVRARHAVVEAAILVTRLHMIPAVEIADRLAALAPLVEKTGGPEEREAFALLAALVAARARVAESGAAHRPSEVEIRAPARFHLGMFSFGDPHARSFGGTGLLLEEPATVVRVRTADAFGGDGPGGQRAAGFARVCAASWNLPGDAAFHVTVSAAPRAHVGLGSGTQLALAVAAGVEALAGRRAPDGRGFDPAQALGLVHAAGRGKRSSVGAYGFALGGLVVEAGRLGADKVAAPSGVSPLVAHVVLPEAWRGVLVIERGAEGLHGDAERAAFEALAPVDRGVSAELARLALLDLVPAAIEGRFDAFALALGAYGRLAGIPFEAASRRLPFHEAIERLLARLASLGVAGMAQSSWGPAVLAMCRSQAEAEALAAALRSEGLEQTHDLAIVRQSAGGARLHVIG